MTLDPHAWAQLMSRVAALEARDADLASQLTALREDWRRLETRLYGLVAAGTFGGSIATAALSHTIGA